MSPALITYGSLGIAIVCETLGTSLLKQSEQFTRLLPTLLMALSYICSFYFLSVSLRSLPIGVAYAIWCGLGIVLVSIIGLVVFKQHLSPPVLAGLGLIIAGVAVVNLFGQPAH